MISRCGPIIVALSLITISSGTGTITVQTHEFNQRDSLTSCLTGILADTDTLKLYSVLKKPKDIPTSKLILKIEVKPPESVLYAVINETDLTRCLSRASYDIECAEIDGEHFNITFKYNAKLEYSEASFKVSVTYRRDFFPGNVIVLPKVYDSKNLRFILNKVKLPPMPYKCSIAPIDNGDLHFCCEQSKIFLTTAVIWLNGVNVSSSERCAWYKLQPTESVKTLEFECNFCGVQSLKTSCSMDDDTNNKIKASYTLGKSLDAERIKGDDRNILLEDILLLVTVLPCLILFVVVWTCILQLKNLKSRKNPTAEPKKLIKEAENNQQGNAESKKLIKEAENNQQGNAEPKKLIKEAENNQQGNAEEMELRNITGKKKQEEPLNSQSHSTCPKKSTSCCC